MNREEMIEHIHALLENASNRDLAVVHAFVHGVLKD